MMGILPFTPNSLYNQESKTPYSLLKPPTANFDHDRGEDILYIYDIDISFKGKSPSHGTLVGCTITAFSVLI